MLEELSQLEQSARRLEPVRAEKERIAGAANDYVHDFIEGLPGMPTFHPGETPALKALQVEEEGKPFERLLDILQKEVNIYGINAASGGHLGYIPGGGVWAAAIGDFLAAATNRYTGVFYASPGGVLIENQMISWLCALAGYPAAAHGVLCSGGSIANLTAVKTARDAKGIDSANVRRAVVYHSAHVHHCVPKALDITGLGETVRRYIPMDGHYRMDVSALQAAIQADVAEGLLPFLVIASAGTTDTGAVDPLDAIADICEAYDIWFHVDAAYGGFFLLLDEMKSKFKGIERSDSLVLDPHKGMFLPYGLGVALVKDAQKLLASFSHQAAYMQDAYGFDELSPADCGPELSKHFRGLRMWLPLHLHGVGVFRDNLREKMLLCRYFHTEIQKMGFETGPEPDLSVTMFRYPGPDADAFNQRLVAALHRDGRVFFSSTVIDGAFWIRCAVFSFRTHLAEIRLGLEMIGQCLEAAKVQH